MKAHLKVFILLFTFLPQTGFCQIYISPSGNDNNSGTKDQPLATLLAARDHARILRKSRSLSKPIEIIIRKGVYFMDKTLILTAEDSGSDLSPLVFKADGEENPIFCGGIDLKNFEKFSEKTWRCDTKLITSKKIHFEQLYVNGVRSKRAQSPDTLFYQPTKVTETVIEKGTGRVAQSAVQKIGLPKECVTLLQHSSERELKEAVAIIYHKWDNTIKYIQSYNKADSSITIKGEGLKSWNPIDTNSIFVIQNLRSSLDSPGEWFLDSSGYLYYNPLKGQTLENIKVLAPSIQQFVVIQGDSANLATNIRFENITFSISAYNLPKDGAEPIQAAAPIQSAIEVNFARNIIFSSCEVEHTGGNAIWFKRACQNSQVNDCYLHDLGAGAIKIGEVVINSDSIITNSVKIYNNIITSGGWVFPCSAAVTIFKAKNNIISHNEISDFKYSGISVGWVYGYSFSPSTQNIIEFNHIHHLGWGLMSDMGGIYTLGKSAGTVIRNNNIHHIYSRDYGGWGLYTDEGSSDILIENNLVYQCKSAAFHQHYGEENIVRNNIFALNWKSQLQATKVESHRSFSFTNNIIFYNSGTLLSSSWSGFNILSDYNCYWDVRGRDIQFGKRSFFEWQKLGKDIHSIIEDPGFVNFQKFDFHLKNYITTKKINFVPFDYSQAGVLGNLAWKKKAEMSKLIVEKFNKIVTILESQKEI